MDGSKPLKMSLTNLATGATIRPQYNPETFEEEHGTAWAKIVVPGLSHPRKQFINTEETTFSIQLPFNSVGGGPDQQSENMFARKFLIAATKPRLGAGSVATAGAPRILFVWPGMLSLTCVIDKVRFQYRSFQWLGPANMFTATVAISEIRDALSTMEETLIYGGT